MICPCCGKRVKRTHFSCQAGAKGGAAATGKAKARTSEQARKAVNARWKKHNKTDIMHLTKAGRSCGFSILLSLPPGQGSGSPGW